MRVCLRNIKKDTVHFVHLKEKQMQDGEPDIIKFNGELYIYVDVEQDENDEDVYIYKEAFPVLEIK